MARIVPFDRDTSETNARPMGWPRERRLRDEIPRFLDLFRFLGGDRDEARAPRDAFHPHMDIGENDEGHIVTLEAPGVDAEDLDVSVDSDHLVISGEKKEDVGGRNNVRERRTGSFTRRAPVPDDVDIDGVTAVLQNGVLSVRMPRTAEAGRSPRRIRVDAGETPEDGND